MSKIKFPSKEHKTPTAQNFWNHIMQEKYNATINWTQQYQLIKASTNDTTLRMLQYKLLNNLITTKSKLKIMKIQDDDICNFCKA